MASLSMLAQNPLLSFNKTLKTPIRFKSLLPVSTSISPLPKLYFTSSLNQKNLTLHKKQSSFFQTFRNGSAIFLLTSFLLFSNWGRKNSLSLASENKIETQKKEELEDDDEDELFAEILDRNSADVDTLKMFLYEKMKKGKKFESVKCLERLIVLEPDEMEWRLLHALSYELMGDIGKAKKLFREILKKNPLLLRALHGLALAMYKNKEGPAAFALLNKALDLAHRERRVIEERSIKILIAQMYVVKGDLEEALKQFEELIKEDPRDFRPHLCQGIIYSLLEKNEEASEQFEIYRCLIPDEFPQRGFIDDVILAAKTESQEQVKKEFQSER